LSIRRRTLPEQHPEILTSIINLADTLFALGEVISARELQEQVLRDCRAAFGEENLMTVTAMEQISPFRSVPRGSSPPHAIAGERIAIPPPCIDG